MRRNKEDLRRTLQSCGTVLALLAIVLAFSAIRPGSFCTLTNFINITRQISLLVVISLGATLVMSVGEFDLSVGEMASLGGVMAAQMAVAGGPLAGCFTLPILASAVVGLVNGWVVARFRALSFITTLGMSGGTAGATPRVCGRTISPSMRRLWRWRIALMR